MHPHCRLKAKFLRPLDCPHLKLHRTCCRMQYMCFTWNEQAVSMECFCITCTIFSSLSSASVSSTVQRPRRKFTTVFVRIRQHSRVSTIALHRITTVSSSRKREGYISLNHGRCFIWSLGARQNKAKRLVHRAGRARELGSDNALESIRF